MSGGGPDVLSGTVAELFGISMTTVPEIPEGISHRNAALLYAECGWFVLPLKPDNSPAIDKWDTCSTRDPEQICKWWPEDSKRGIGLHAGRSGALVIDVDEPTKMPDTWRTVLREFNGPVQRTRADATPDDPYSRRAHLVGLMPPNEEQLGNGLGTLGAGWCDVRGKNGYIVAEPTAHPKGGRYGWVRVGALQLFPAALYAGLRGRGRVRVTPTGQTLGLVGAGDTAAFFKSLPHGEPCAAMAAELADALETLSGISTGRHGEARDSIGRLLRLGEQGHLGVRPALGELQDAFVSSVTTHGALQRTYEGAVHEFKKMIARDDGSSEIVSLILEDPTPDDEKGCWCDADWDPTTGPDTEIDTNIDVNEEGESENATKSSEMSVRDARIKVVERLRLEAKEEYQQEKLIASWRQPEILIGDAFWSIPEPDEPWTLTGMARYGGNTLIVAPNKTGKSTYIANIARSLVDNVPFLTGSDQSLWTAEPRFMPRKIDGRVGFLNFEIPDWEFRKYTIGPMGLKNRGSFAHIGLKDTTLPIMHDHVFDWLVKRIREEDIEILILDPYGRLAADCNINEKDNFKAYQLTQRIDALKAESGARDLFITAHTGWDVEDGAERARGASAFEGWYTSKMVLTKDKTRRFHRIDVGRPGIIADEKDTELHLDTRTGILTEGITSRKEARSDDLTEKVLEILREQPGITTTNLYGAVEKTEVHTGGRTELGNFVEKNRDTQAGPWHTHKGRGVAIKHYAGACFEGCEGRA